MIRRSPRPDFSFTILRNDVLRDERLTYRARGLLAAMLSFPDNWEFNREWLAKHSGGEGVLAIRTALQEMEAVGYLRRWKTKNERGQFVWHHMLYDEAPSDVSAGHSTGRLPADGEPTDGNRPPKEEPSRTTVEEDELNCPDELRFAPFVGADDSQEDPDSYEDWASDDLAMFTDLAGRVIQSDGSVWKPAGRYSGEAFWKAIRHPKRGKARKRWPGRWAKSIDERGQLEEWMASQGLETVE